MRTSARSLAIKVTYVRSLYNNLQSCSYTVLDRNNLLESMISRRQPKGKLIRLMINHIVSHVATSNSLILGYM